MRKVVCCLFLMLVLFFLQISCDDKVVAPEPEQKIIEILEPQSTGQIISSSNFMIFVVKFKLGNTNNFDLFYSIDNKKTWSQKIDADQLSYRSGFGHSVFQWTPDSLLQLPKLDTVYFQAARYGEGACKDIIGPIYIQ